VRLERTITAMCSVSDSAARTSMCVCMLVHVHGLDRREVLRSACKDCMNRRRVCLTRHVVFAMWGC
jgi:hypothetical protein